MCRSCKVGYVIAHEWCVRVIRVCQWIFQLTIVGLERSHCTLCNVYNQFITNQLIPHIQLNQYNSLRKNSSETNTIHKAKKTHCAKTITNHRAIKKEASQCPLKIILHFEIRRSPTSSKLQSAASLLTSHPGHFTKQAPINVSKSLRQDSHYRLSNRKNKPSPRCLWDHGSI